MIGRFISTNPGFCPECGGAGTICNEEDANSMHFIDYEFEYCGCGHGWTDTYEQKDNARKYKYSKIWSE